jgi:hypothetical protein
MSRRRCNSASLGGGCRGQFGGGALCDGRLRDAGAAEHDDRVRDVVLVEQGLRLQVIEHQPHAAHIGTLQEIGVAVGLAVARAVDDLLDLRRRRGVVGTRVGPLLGQGALALARGRRLLHVRSILLRLSTATGATLWRQAGPFKLAVGI